MANHTKGKKPWNWTGKPIVASNGYVLIFVGKSHHLADVRGYAYEHRLVAEKATGRRLRKGEQIHHKNGIKTDNRADNIEVCASMAHHKVSHRKRNKGLRMPDEPNLTVCCDCGCGRSFQRFDSSGRPRRFVSGHNQRK